MDFSYRPNFNDPRVKKRVELVLAWCSDNLSEKYERPVPKEQLEEVFGPIGNKLSDYLRANILIRSDMYKPGLKYFKYKLKANGLDKVALLAASINSYIVNTSAAEMRISRIEQKFKQELQSLSFNYMEKSNRYWHPLQNLKSADKDLFWKDRLPFNYDIDACAPTLFLQTAKKSGLSKVIANKIKDYIDNKDAYRQHVAKIADITLKDAKRLINSLFNGARLAKTTYCAAYNLLREYHSAGQAAIKMDELQNDTSLRLLRLAIKQGWKKISTALNFDVNNSKQKWSLYFLLEKTVLDAMTSSLKEQKINFFTEHDGFRTDKPININLIQTIVKDKTGYDITLISNQ